MSYGAARSLLYQRGRNAISLTDSFSTSGVRTRVEPSTLSPQPPDLAAHILAYLVRHPDAQDTLAGIVRWWLLEERISYWTAQVNEVLGELVAQDLVLERTCSDERVHYRINQSAMERIRARLAPAE